MVIGIVPTYGGALSQYVSWRWCFYINLPIGAISSIFIYFTQIPDEIPKPPFSLALLRHTIPHLDLIGCCLFTPAIVLLLLALQWGSETHGSENYGWSSPTVIGLFVGSGVTLILFCLWERNIGDKALIPLSLVRQRIVWTSTIQNSFLFVTNFIGSNFLPIYFQAVKGIGPSLSSIYMLPSILTQLLCLLVSGVLVQRVGFYLPFGVFSGVVTAIACGLISTWSIDTDLAKWIGYQILFGLRGVGLQTAIISIQYSVTPAQTPIAISFLIFAQSLLAAISIIIANALFTQTLTKQVGILAPSVNPELALAAGGSGEAVRALLPVGSPELKGLLLAYTKGISAVFYFLVAVASVCFAAAWGMGWVDIRKKKEARHIA